MVYRLDGRCLDSLSDYLATIDDLRLLADYCSSAMVTSN
jgi:hypothetical protein